MKNINDFISSIKENKYDTTAGIPNWADFISIDIEAEEMEFFALKDIKDNKIKKLKLGESYKDSQLGLIWVCITDLSALNEK